MQHSDVETMLQNFEAYLQSEAHVQIAVRLTKPFGGIEKQYYIS